MLGFDVSERMISRWMKRAPRDPEPARRWLAFLRNHREPIAAMDPFTEPMITFRVLYAFFVITHDRRRILHFNITRHPTNLWVVQQLREAFLFESALRFLIFDRDTACTRTFPPKKASLPKAILGQVQALHPVAKRESRHFSARIEFWRGTAPFYNAFMRTYLNSSRTEVTVGRGLSFRITHNPILATDRAIVQGFSRVLQ